MQYIYRKEYYSVIKKDEVMTFAVTWLDLESVILSEVSQRKRNTVWHPLYMESKKKDRNESKVAQSCLALWDRMDYSLPGSSIHGIFQARILEWVAISFSRGSSRPRNQTRVSSTAGRRFTVWATREALVIQKNLPTKQKEIQRLRTQNYGCQREGIIRDFWKIMYTLLYFK